MALPTNSSTERTLGVILGKLEGIESRLSKQDESRALLHGRVDEIRDRVSGIESELIPIRKDVTDAKAVTDDVKRWRTMGVGALAVTGMGAAAIASLVTAYWSKIVNAIVGP